MPDTSDKSSVRARLSNRSYLLVHSVMIMEARMHAARTNVDNRTAWGSAANHHVMHTNGMTKTWKKMKKKISETIDIRELFKSVSFINAIYIYIYCVYVSLY